MALLQPLRAHVAGQGSTEPFPELLVHPRLRSPRAQVTRSTPAAGTDPAKAVSEGVTVPIGTAGWVTQAWPMAVGKAM